MNTSTKEEVINMCHQFLREYLLDSNKPIVTKEEIVKSLFDLTPNIKSCVVTIHTEEGEVKQVYNLRYRRSEYPEQYVWRKAVLKRDNHTCQRCKKNTELHVHHKERWVDAPALRFSVDNGITVCRKCHKLIHKKGLLF
jgi:5-methylcytosine-specific restriction endonuclease McrA